MRKMSFAMTTEQILARSKTVTRRLGWAFLKPGDRVQPVLKSMGLKRGETVQLLGGPIEIISVRREPLNAITEADVIAEGFPAWTPQQFIEVLVKHYRIAPDTEFNRIEFRYVDKESTP